MLGFRLTVTNTLITEQIDICMMAWEAVVTALRHSLFVSVGLVYLNCHMLSSCLVDHVPSSWLTMGSNKKRLVAWTRVDRQGSV